MWGPVQNVNSGPHLEIGKSISFSHRPTASVQHRQTTPKRLKRLLCIRMCSVLTWGERMEGQAETLTNVQWHCQHRSWVPATFPSPRKHSVHAWLETFPYMCPNQALVSRTWIFPIMWANCYPGWRVAAVAGQGQERGARWQGAGNREPNPTQWRGDKRQYHAQLRASIPQRMRMFSGAIRLHLQNTKLKTTLLRTSRRQTLGFTYQGQGPLGFRLWALI